MFCKEKKKNSEQYFLGTSSSRFFMPLVPIRLRLVCIYFNYIYLICLYTAPQGTLSHKYVYIKIYSAVWVCLSTKWLWIKKEQPASSSLVSFTMDIKVCLKVLGSTTECVEKNSLLWLHREHLIDWLKWCHLRQYWLGLKSCENELNLGVELCANQTSVS